jgi:hypothetical protein
MSVAEQTQYGGKLPTITNNSDISLAVAVVGIWFL